MGKYKIKRLIIDDEDDYPTQKFYEIDPYGTYIKTDNKRNKNYIRSIYFYADKFFYGNEYLKEFPNTPLNGNWVELDFKSMRSRLVSTEYLEKLVNEGCLLHFEHGCSSDSIKEDKESTKENWIIIFEKLINQLKDPYY